MQEIIKRYLEAWNETDAAARLALVAHDLWLSSVRGRSAGGSR